MNLKSNVCLKKVLKWYHFPFRTVSVRIFLGFPNVFFFQPHPPFGNFSAFFFAKLSLNSTQLNFNFSRGWYSFISSFRHPTHPPVEVVRWCNPSPVNTLKSLKYTINTTESTPTAWWLALPSSASSQSNYWAWHYLTPACSFSFTSLKFY